jgi:hypothetical protein
MMRIRRRLASEENMWKSSLWLLAALALIAGASCLTDNVEIPELTGPSTVARSITVRAIPDAIVSDGFSSSVIEAVMVGPNGERVSGATIIFEIQASGQFLDLGNLAPLNGPRPVAGGVEAGPVSAVTDGDGVARARYWAPFRTDQENDTTVTIAARESGTNTRGATFAEADVFLRAANRPDFPGGEVCGFIWEPEKIVYDVGEGISFTATQSTGDTSIDGCVGNPIARYEWLISDGTTKTSRGIVHAFSEPGTFTIILVTHESVTGCRATCSVTLDVE